MYAYAFAIRVSKSIRSDMPEWVPGRYLRHYPADSYESPGFGAFEKSEPAPSLARATLFTSFKKATAAARNTLPKGVAAGIFKVSIEHAAITVISKYDEDRP